MIPVMLRPDLFQSPRPMKSIGFDPDWVHFLWTIQPLMNANERGLLQTGLSPFMGNLYPRQFSSSVLLCLDAWAEIPALSPEMWLALAWNFHGDWRVAPGNTFGSLLAASGSGPLPVPAVDDHVVEGLARHLETAYSSRSSRSVTSSLHEVLRPGDPSAPFSIHMVQLGVGRIKKWHAAGLLESNSMADLLKIELCLKGLRDPSDRELLALKELAGDRRNPLASEFGALLYRTQHPANPWIEILRNSGTAASEAVKWTGGEQEARALNDLVFWVERSPPEQEVVRTIWDVLRHQSRSAGTTQKPKIFGTLFRLAHLLPSEERLAMRRDYLTAIKNQEFGILAFTGDDGWGIPMDPLAYAGGGMGIPWEDDELSAGFSWSSNFQRLIFRTPEAPPNWQPNDAFHFLTLGADPRLFYNQGRMEPPSITAPPPSAPFEATPWQRARALHLRRPDLDVR
jgi:hypothetical protein